MSKDSDQRKDNDEVAEPMSQGKEDPKSKVKI